MHFAQEWQVATHARYDNFAERFPISAKEQRVSDKQQAFNVIALEKDASSAELTARGRAILEEAIRNEIANGNQILQSVATPRQLLRNPVTGRYLRWECAEEAFNGATWRAQPIHEQNIRKAMNQHFPSNRYEVDLKIDGMAFRILTRQERGAVSNAALTRFFARADAWAEATGNSRWRYGREHNTSEWLYEEDAVLEEMIRRGGVQKIHANVAISCRDKERRLGQVNQNLNAYRSNLRSLQQQYDAARRR